MFPFPFAAENEDRPPVVDIVDDLFVVVLLLNPALICPSSGHVFNELILWLWGLLFAFFNERQLKTFSFQFSECARRLFDGCVSTYARTPLYLALGEANEKQFQDGSSFPLGFFDSFGGSNSPSARISSRLVRDANSHEFHDSRRYATNRSTSGHSLPQRRSL